MKRNTLIITILFILLASFSSYALFTQVNTTSIPQFSSTSTLSSALAEEIILSEEDKKVIIFSILKKTEFQNSYDRELEKTGVLYLSTKNLPASLPTENLPKLKGVSKIVFINPDESKNQRENRFTYWEFRGFRIDKEKVEIGLMVFYSDGNSSGCGYEYKKKEDGMWEGKITGCFAAAS